jgi:hypothetical protein
MSSPNSETRRIHFYGVHDYGTFLQIPEVYEALCALGDQPKVRSINDIVELWHLMQFIEVDLLPPDLAEVDREIVHNKVPLLKIIVGRYFSQLHNVDVTEAISAADPRYREDLLTLFKKYRVYQRCDEEDVIQALLKSDFSIASILACDELVRLYDKSVRTLLIESPIAAELIVKKYLEKNFSLGKNNKGTVNLPKSLTLEDKHQIIEKYISEEFANPNILNLIVNAGANKDVGIDDLTKLDAKRAYESFWNKHFETHEGMTFGCQVLLADDQQEESTVTDSGLEIAYSYSKEWLTKYTDNSTIMNNFIYVFDYSTKHMLLNFPSFESEMGVFEKVMGIKGNKEYQTGIGFEQKEAVSVLQMQMYTQLLRSIDIRLEDVIAWFFNTHISTEYHADNFQFQPSSSTATFLERDRHLFSEMESLLHQYVLFVKFGKIDRDLLSVSSAPIVYQQLPSLLKKKYVYLSNDENIQKIQHLLFSDQSMLGYIDDDLNESTFVKLISNHDVCIEQLQSYQIPEINFLRNLGILSDQPGKSLRFNNVLQIVILYEIHSFGVASFLHYPEEGKSAD